MTLAFCSAHRAVLGAERENAARTAFVEGAKATASGGTVRTVDKAADRGAIEAAAKISAQGATNYSQSALAWMLRPAARDGAQAVQNVAVRNIR